EIRLRTNRLVVATGIVERPPVFGNNDLPGIMLGRAVQRLIHLYGARPGTRAVVVGSNAGSLRVAADLINPGIEVAAYADHRDQTDRNSDAQVLTARNVQLISGLTSISAHGSNHIDRVSLGTKSGPAQSIACDLLVFSTGGDPAIHLLQQAGAR